MGKKKKDRLLLNLLEGEKHRHRVAMVNEEGAFNQHEPNSNMARMFVVMLLIHVVVIGGIIIYDWMNGEEMPQPATATREHRPVQASPLPQPALGMGAQDPMSSEEYATYEWRSGDSIQSVAKKLEISEETLIKLNMLDQGAQIEQNTILRYPKRPVVKAKPIGLAGAHGDAAVPAPAQTGLAAAQAPASLPPAKEQTFSFQPDIMGDLTPAPQITPMPVQDTPPPAVTKAPAGEPEAKPAPRQEPKVADTPLPAPKAVEKPVPKAIPVTRPPQQQEKAQPKKVVDSTPDKKAAPKAAARAGTHTVKPGETLYSISSRYGVTVKALQTANKITRPELLRDGMTLTIPGK